MTEPLTFIATFRVPAGKADEVRDLVAAYTEFVDVHEERTLAVQFLLDAAETRLINVHTQQDAAAMDAHLELARDRIAAALELVEPEAIIVCGEPGPVLSQVLEHNRQRGATVTVLPQRIGGFVRPAA
jgi:hypothetical protein